MGVGGVLGFLVIVFKMDNGVLPQNIQLLMG